MILEDDLPAYLTDDLHRAMMQVPGSRLRTAAEVAALSYRDTEFCGVLLGNPEAGCAWLDLPNSAADRAHRYSIAASALAVLMEENIAFSAVWHTHPPIPTRSRLSQQLEAEERSAGPRPSTLDLDYHPLAYRMLIWHLGECREFNVRGEELSRWSVGVSSS